MKSKALLMMLLIVVLYTNPAYSFELKAGTPRGKILKKIGEPLQRLGCCGDVYDLSENRKLKRVHGKSTLNAITKRWEKADYVVLYYDENNIFQSIVTMNSYVELCKMADKLAAVEAGLKAHGSRKYAANSSTYRYYSDVSTLKSDAKGVVSFYIFGVPELAEAIERRNASGRYPVKEISKVIIDYQTNQMAVTSTTVYDDTGQIFFSQEGRAFSEIIPDSVGEVLKEHMLDYIVSISSKDVY